MKKYEFPRWGSWMIAAAGLGLMAYGCFRGETAVVWKKAVNICLECIGIG